MKLTYILWAGIIIAAFIDMMYEMKRYKKNKAKMEGTDTSAPASRIGANKKNKKRKK